MGYSPGFLVKIGRFRLIANVPEKFTNNPVRSQKSICKHLCDVFREFGPISSTYQNPPSSKPWAKAQAFSSKSADSGSLQMFPKTSRTIPYVVRNRFASIFATFVGSLGRIPALAKISHVQNHGLQSRLFGQNRPISAQFKCSRKLHEQSRTQLEIHLQAYLRRFQGVCADFQHLPKSAMFKTMGYSPGFLVEIGRFRSNSNVPENFTNNPVPSWKSICKHISDVFREFGPNSSTYQNPPSSKPWAIAQAFWSKSADFGSLQILPNTSRKSLYALRNPFASILATFLGRSGRFPALTKIRLLQTHDFMGYSQDFLVKIGRFRLIPNYPENFTNNPVRSQKSICKHICDVFREFGPISSTYQNQPTSKPCAIAQAFWSKSADFG